MMHLKSEGIVLFLDAELAALESRIHNFNSRGLVKQAEQSFAQLFAERLPLYRKFADATVNSTGLNPEEVCMRIINALEN
jgi:shikimate kinase